MFYPGEALDLQSMIDGFLKSVPKQSISGAVKILIAPHAGYVYSGEVAAYAFSLLKNLDQKKEWKVVIFGPSHHRLFNGASVSTDSFWETPLGKVPVCDLRDECKNGPLVDEKSAHMEEHSLEVEVPFLQMVLKKFKIYPLCLGNVSPSKLADAVLDFCARDDVLLVASSDLSHYYPYKQALEIDSCANKSVPALDIPDFENHAEACGKTGVLAAMRIAKNLGFKGHFLNYKNSGDTAGDKFQVVGYGAYAFTKP